MICDFCHEREAVIFVEQVSSDGQKRKINMCTECAIARGISPDPKKIESSIIGDLFNELTLTARKLELENNRMCPVCGTSLTEIKKTGHAGCPECYAVFKDQMRTYLTEQGITGAYTGSMPARLASFHSVLNDRIAIQNKLDEAVAKEDYEKAALYRDYLHALEKRTVSGDEESADNNVPSGNSWTDIGNGGAL